jgi:prepilin-type N-terminal cleavage/methylation domain-containing protein/prepilin-type processing-associated H-X9-DG protein
MYMRGAGVQNWRRKGFTLVELLVVISIISLLLGILMPSLNKVRQIARKTTCKAQLHDIALAIRMYLDDNSNRMPPAAGYRNVTYSYDDLSQTAYSGRPPIVKYLGSYLSVPSDQLSQVDSKKIYCKVFSCPGDNYNNTSQYYYKIQTTSYAYNDALGGRILDRTAFRSGSKLSDMEAMGDFDAFHGKKPIPADDTPEAFDAAKAETVGSYNYLFADCHVGDRKGF